MILAPVLAALLAGAAAQEPGAPFRAAWDALPDRTWVGPDFWANRLQDWRVEDGAVRCVEARAARPVRSLHWLSGDFDAAEGQVWSTAVVDPLADGGWREGAFAGFLVGAGGPGIDPRLTALVHAKPGADGGLLAVVDGRGRARLRDFSTATTRGAWSIDGPLDPGSVPDLAPRTSIGAGFPGGRPQPFQARLVLEPERLVLSVASPDGREVWSTAVWDELPEHALDGSLALVSHLGPRAHERGFAFRSWSAGGAGVRARPARRLGPVVAVQYTLSGGELRLTAQSVPFGPEDPKRARLEVRRGEGWREVARAELAPLSCTFPFRVSGWSEPEDVPFRVVVDLAGGAGNAYEGTLRAEPDEEELRVAAFTCHKVFTGGQLAWNHDAVWFPHTDLTEPVAPQEPHLLFFSGDQIYEGDLVGAELDPDGDSIEDYLYKWYRWCWAFGDLTRRYPAITIPDDHDVYHGNIWGAGGIRAVARGDVRAQDAGGYVLRAELVEAIHRTQTSHLPEPWDATPIGQGITPYTTSVDYGGASFAVLADRMWKSSPTLAMPAGRVVNGFFQAEDFDPVTGGDPEGAELLGPVQLAFLEEWAADWGPGVDFKVALSQSLFANLATLPAPARTDAVTPGLEVVPPGGYPEGDVPVADCDSNGWPRSGRDRAVRALRKAFALHLAGDQHLGAVVRYGLDAWRDAGFAFSLPSVANTWPRRWFPGVPGARRAPGAPRYTGDFTDGFGNRMTVLAAANPSASGREPAALHDRAPGWALVRLDRRTREVTFECWPRGVDPRAPGARQFPGWPVRFHQLDGDGREPVQRLGPVGEGEDGPPVVSLVDARTGERVYTLRAPDASFRPPVPAPGAYRLEVDGRPRPEVLVGTARPAPGPDGPSRRPNVVFLLADDLRHDGIGANGNPHVSTPHLDRLVAEGVSFDRAYCMGSNSGAVCAPSRAMILSGRGLADFVEQPYEPALDCALMPEAFRRAGYATFGTGKWHNGRAWFQRCFEDGGEIFFGGMGPHTGLRTWDHDPTGAYPGDARTPQTAFSSTAFVDEALGFLRERDASRPFFLYVAFTAPHDPRTPPAEVRARYDAGALPLPANFLPEHPFDNGELAVRDERLAPVPRDPDTVREHLADYYGMVTQLDGEVGRLLDELDARGLREETIVVFASDHGLALGSHGLLGKQNLYEHSMRAPVVLAGPGLPAGVRRDALVYLSDLFPTLLELAGLERPASVTATSLVPSARGDTGAERERVFTAYRRVQRAVTERRWKLIEYPSAGRRQLFDLREDPHETTDLAGKPEHADVEARLARELETFSLESARLR